MQVNIRMHTSGAISSPTIKMELPQKISTSFRNSINSIGNVLLILSPCNDPMPIRRACCLFKIYQTLSEADLELTIDLPYSEIEELKAEITTDSTCLIRALSDIQAENAQAAVNSDREMIFRVIVESDGGLFHVSQNVKKGLRGWYIDQF